MLGFVEVAPLVIVGVDLTAFVVALMIVLVVIAGWVVLWILHITLGRISILGFHPFDVFYNSAQDAIHGLWSYMAKRVPALGHFLWSLVMIVWRPLYVIGATLAGLLTQIVGVNQNSQRGLAQLRAQEQSDVQIIDRYIENAQQEITDNAIFAQTYTDTRVENIYNQLTREDVQRVAAEANRAVGVETGLQTRLNTDVNTINTRITNNVNTLNTRITNNVNTINATITRDVQDLTRADATNLNRAESFATGLVSGLNIGALRQTVTALQTDLNKVKTETTECLDPLCNTVTPQAKRLGNLGKWLGDLEALAAAALLIAIAEEARTDPAGVAHDIEAVVQGVGDGVFQGFRDIIGL